MNEQDAVFAERSRPSDDLTNRSVASFLMAKLAQFIELTAEERACLDSFESEPDHIAAGELLVRENDPLTRAGVLVDGWCASYKLLSDGRQQIVNFILPGSFLGLHANVFKYADHAISTLTPCRISWFDPQEITGIFAAYPRLATAIVWDAAREQSFLMERVASLGRRSAYERFAHLLIELAILLEKRGISQSEGQIFPITQTVLSDALGLSTVHVSRTLRQLRKDGLIEPDTKRGVAIRDFEGLKAACDFDKTYLHETPVPAKTEQAITT